MAVNSKLAQNNLSSSQMASTGLQNSVLFYGDNLDILRSPKNYIPPESIDLIYLDPPFNSKADYNVLFKEVDGEPATAQIQAFSDFWHWDKAAAQTHQYLTVGNAVPDKVASAADALYRILGRSDMTAYLFMMTLRLVELHRVLKPTGSLFLHCDTTASHYLKVVLDSIFGVKNFRNEIVWKRFNFHADARRFGRISDKILFYSKTDEYKFTRQGAPIKKEYLESHFDTDEKGRQFTTSDLNPPHGRGPIYKFHGVTRPWRFTKEKMLKLEAEGRIYSKSPIPRIIRYRDEIESRGGIAVPEIWDDIYLVNSMAGERLGFPTQKPTKLLERIIAAGSDEGGWILDPFCGCGTAVIAAEKMHRNWIGIDVTYLAINIMKNRLNGSFPYAKFRIEGEPKDVGAATALATQDKLNGRYQFQWWALTLVGAIARGSTPVNPGVGKKGADHVVDGILRFGDGKGGVERIIVQVKSGHVGVRDIRELRDAVNSQEAAMPRLRATVRGQHRL